MLCGVNSDPGENRSSRQSKIISLQQYPRHGIEQQFGHYRFVQQDMTAVAGLAQSVGRGVAGDNYRRHAFAELNVQ